jgi:hypothetical protein
LLYIITKNATEAQGKRGQKVNPIKNILNVLDHGNTMILVPPGWMALKTPS